MTIGTSTTTKKKASQQPQLYDVPESPANEVIDSVECSQSGANFGIRSYLHQFYDLNSPDENDPWISASHRRAIRCWRVILILGACALILGAVGIIVGYLWPQAQQSIKVSGAIDGYLIVEKPEESAYDWVRILKIVALAMFAAGGMMIAIALLVPTFCYIWNEKPSTFKSSKTTSPKLEQSPTKTKSEDIKEMATVSPTGKKIPMMEDIQPVQPTSGKRSHTISESDLLLDDDK